jgi:acetyl esterase/lipase
MKRTALKQRTVLVLVLSFVLLTVASGLALAGKRPISYDAYDGWRSIQGAQLSRDGHWLAYALAPEDGDGTLVILNLQTNKEYRAPRGREPVITADGKFVVFAVAPLKADTDKAKKEKKKSEEQPKAGLGLMNLATGAVATADRVKSFKVPEESGAYVAYLTEPPLKLPAVREEADKKTGAKAEAKKEEPKNEEKKKEPGTDLVIRDLATGRETRVSEVVEYAWAKDGARLAYAVSSKTSENDGAFLWEAATGRTATLLKGPGNYMGLIFDEKGGQLAFTSDRDDFKSEKSASKLYYWHSPAGAAVELVPALAGNFPAGMSVSESSRLSFSKDGARLFFGIAPAPKPEPKDAPEPVPVDIWNWRDPDLQPMQKVRADEEKKRSFLCVMHLGPGAKKFVRLATEDVPDVTPPDDAKLAVGSSDLPYRQLISWDRGYEDVYLVSLTDGSRKKILEKSPYGASLSPGGNYLVYFNDGDRGYHTYRVADGRRFNLTAKLGPSFVDETWDMPGEPVPYGVAGWTDGDRSVLVYDRYDIWEIAPDGSRARTVTAGAGRREKLVFRYLKLDEDEKTIPARKPIILSATDDLTKASGAYRATISGPGGPARIIMLDKLFRGLIKAKNADVYAFTWQRFDEFPDLWTSGDDFAAARRVSDANPQQAEYNWGRAELIDYTNGDGITLPAVLIKPEDFDAAKKYPLMVYLYETLSESLHRYYPPAPGTNINFTRYASNGYVILMPDIVYEVGYPGPSALKCVVPAVEKVLGMGFVDPKRIGIQGHSWGGYEITYMITQTDIFAAVEAGASVANMTSAYGGIRWGSGMSRAFQYEKSQSRIGAPLWARPLLYIANSPIFWIERVKTPYLTIHDDDDDAVPWYQGIEFFTAMRRLGKEAYLFDFNGEKHGLRERENQKYWTVHLDEFFDHFLLGKPEPEWMSKGVPYLERGRRDIDALFKKAEGKKAGAPAL